MEILSPSLLILKGKTLRQLIFLCLKSTINNEYSEPKLEYILRTFHSSVISQQNDLFSQGIVGFDPEKNSIKQALCTMVDICIGNHQKKSPINPIGDNPAIALLCWGYLPKGSTL